MEEIKLEMVVDSLSDEELAEIAGGARPGPGWIKTVTLDCPAATFWCCG
ncbi:type A2 lanthipeptide [Bacillus sp. 165]|nr:type A2 lanthipeptide [Bacillus sp. 165]MBO9131335.1 type A2 lantipeptide [Bacillus sp. 165]